MNESRLSPDTGLDALLPCPFCGEQPFERFEKNPNGPKYPDHWSVWCENLDCKAGGEAMEETQEATRAAWNTRAPGLAQGPHQPAKPSAGELADKLERYARDCIHIGSPESIRDLLDAAAIIRSAPPVSGADSGVREALKPFISFSDGTMFSHLPDDFVLTAGSRLAHRQLTAGDFRALRTALASSGNAGALDPVTVEREKIARIIHDVELAQEGKRPISDGDWNALKNIKRLSSFCFAAADAIRALIGQPAPASNAKEPVAWLYEMAFYIKPTDAEPFRQWKQVVTIEPPPTIPKGGVRNVIPLAPAGCASKAVTSTDWGQS
jgi:hypothetical protein